MQTISSIQINNLFYTPTGDENPLFKAVNLSFNNEKVGLIGCNGVGKSTLLQLIAGDILPSQGNISSSAKIAFLSQELSTNHEDTVAHVIGINEKLEALNRITQGSIDPDDYSMLCDDWHIEERAKTFLDRFDMSYLDLMQTVSSLSGGERTRLHLIRVFMSDAKFILLDEPTNNLDVKSREMLYRELATFSGGLIVASHDRELLRRMDKIIELTKIGATLFGGNYDDYILQRKTQREAKERQFVDAKKQLMATHRVVQKNKEKQQRRAKTGKDLKRSGSQSKLIINAQKEKSSGAQGRLSRSSDRRLHDTQEKIAEIKGKTEAVKDLRIDLSSSKLPTNKVISEMNNVTFYYDSSRPVISAFSLKIVGPERIALIGENGSGKSTLVKLIAGVISPSEGELELGVSNIHYLDQHASALNPSLTVLSNFKKLNPTLSEFECRNRLAQFLFRNAMAEKHVGNLSGGEKLRALLACVLMAAESPQLIILDEPTNHLDLESISVIEQSLKQYQGALLVISHDKDFLNNIVITKKIEAPFV